MKRFAVLLVGVTGFVIIAASDWLAWGGSENDTIIAACKAAISDRLLSPSSFTLVETGSVVKRPATWEEHQGWDLAPELREKAEAAEAAIPSVAENAKRMREFFDAYPVTLFRVEITYDAKNAFGVMVRATDVCDHDQTDLSIEKQGVAPEASAVRINGYSAVDWAFRNQ